MSGLPSGPVDTLTLVLLAALVTYVWRFLGVVLSARVDPEGELFVWVGCVSYALVAALVARMLLLPSGELAHVPLWQRLAALAVAFAAFHACRRNTVAGVAAGVAAFVVLVKIAG